MMGSLNINGIYVWAQGYTDRWWLAVSLVTVQAILYMLALPGSAIFWIAAPLYPPLQATIILVSGSTLGGIGGYFFVGRLARPWLDFIHSNRFFILLEKHSDFLTQCAIRTLPSFPHSVINYSAGLLRLPIMPFIMAALLGISIKTFLYTTALHNAMHLSSYSELLQFKTLSPILLMAILFMIAHIIKILRSGR